MKLSEFSYKNILSYGNKIQTFKFDDKPGLILVEGENGAGKSSIKEALTVAIYGRSAIRKMKDIPNWINKNAYTNVKFTTNSGEIIELDRGIEPNFSDIKINGTRFNLPDKRKVDEFIEEELAKIPFSVFCNTISLSFDDFKSFVNLSKDDKRKIVDRIFGIDILSDMRAKVKDELRENKRTSDILDSAIALNKKNLDSYETQLSTLREKITKRKTELSDQLTTKIETSTQELADAKLKYNNIKNQLDSLGKIKNSKSDELSKIKSSIRDLKTKLELYDQNRCPQCLNDLHSDSSVEIKEKIKVKLNALNSDLPIKQKSLDVLNDDSTNLLLEKSDAESNYYKIKAILESLQTSLEAAQETDSSDELTSIETIISDLRTHINNDLVTNTTLTESKNLYLNLDDLLSDNGIKKSMIDKIIPTLNERILEISEKLEFKFPFEFDSEFNPLISHLGMQISPESLSTGQRKKMNLIVLLAFIEIIKMKHSQMNVMFLDEIFSSLDKNNVYRAISILKEYSEKYGLTIFVVSHESLPEELFDYRICVTQQDHFSEMEIIKI
ncbi:endonuclease subunit [uncultured Caudovirales phage]|uniref:Endonuclease subunit n=1 Tax=uncultured Caudovirales phage TaxID=2100421 RepID=A0A6J5PY76_9CAUD|nr:endonuclease subunit [uncultured Caudovirales phage]CAB4193870.1 endonuclease subunit [uncultured Caudovirales phage]